MCFCSIVREFDFWILEAEKERIQKWNKWWIQPEEVKETNSKLEEKFKADKRRKNRNTNQYVKVKVQELGG